ncbi:60S acidic ribosomal protein P0, partial [Caligus rogercresseyi]
MEGVASVAAVSLQIGYPTLASVPHSIANGMKNLMAVAAVTDITFKEVETLKEYLKDPSKLRPPHLLPLPEVEPLLRLLPLPRLRNPKR